MYEPLPAPLSDYCTQPDLPLIAELDGVEYRKLELIIARSVDGRGGNTPYCLYRDWDRTAVGRITQMQYLNNQQFECISQLRVEIADLVRYYRNAIQSLRHEFELTERP